MSTAFQGGARLPGGKENPEVRREGNRRPRSKIGNQQGRERTDMGTAGLLKYWWVEKKGCQASTGFQKPSKNTKKCFLTHYLVSLLVQFLFYLPVKHYKILLIEKEKENQYRSYTGLLKLGKLPIHQSIALVII